MYIFIFMFEFFFQKIKLFFLIFILFGFIGSISYSNVNSNALVCGDSTGDGKVNIADLSFLINYIFYSGPVPEPIGIANVDNSGEVNIADAFYLSNYIFYSGPAPNCPVIQPIIVIPEEGQTLSSPVYVAVENQGIADSSEINAVKLYYSLDNSDWVYLQTDTSASENLWEFSVELEPGFKYIMVIMESTEARTSPSVLIEVI